MRITSYSMEINSDHTISLVKENAVNYKTNDTSLKNPESIAKMFNDVFRLGYKAEEYFYVLCLNAALRPIGVFEISHGGGSSTLINIREIMQRILLSGAIGFVAVHNHPSGCLSVSQDDINTTRRLIEASNLIGIRFLDHIIIGRTEHCSIKEEGYLQLFD